MSEVLIAPEHLADILRPITAEDIPYFKNNKEWFDSLTWKGQLVLNGSDTFIIMHSGVCDIDGAIYTENDEPLVILVNSSPNKNPIVLFDERIHGINAYINKNLISYSKPDLKTYSYLLTDSEFKIFMYAHSSTDFIDEYTQNEQGFISINDIDYTLDYLRRNAYDFIGIIVMCDGMYVRILEYEMQ